VRGELKITELKPDGNFFFFLIHQCKLNSANNNKGARVFDSFFVMVFLARSFVYMNPHAQRQQHNAHLER
jgi:hypothetical protein